MDGKEDSSDYFFVCAVFDKADPRISVPTKLLFFMKPRKSVPTKINEFTVTVINN